MDDFTMLLGLLMLGCGIYCLYAAVMLKTKGVINKTILLGKDTDPRKCKDKEGYISCVFPKTLVLGAVCTLYAVVDLVNSFFVKIPVLWYIMLAAFLVVLVWFGATTSKAAKKYF